ncbi:MAG: DUF364 domain-containing protein [Pseudomonadota bacterium]|nr:DUF364 domain-containing protein [Pseudomonadota bacterium]
MKKPGRLARRLRDLLHEEARIRTVTAVCIGAAYIAVRLDHGGLGLAAMPAAPLAGPEREAPLPPAASLRGRPAAFLLDGLTGGDHPRHKALALATANALIRQERSDFDGDALDAFHLTADDSVVMVGRFTPLLERIAATGAALAILERDPAKGMVLPAEVRRRVLERGTVAIITATAMLYDELEAILSALGRPRQVSLLGPSTPMLPELFDLTPVTHLGGVKVVDAARIMPIVAAGGSTKAMRPCLEMTNLALKKDFFPG